MAEEFKDKSESQQDNQSQKEDNLLPYEAPKLRKHGKINDNTLTTFPNGGFDGVPPFSDFS